MQTFRKLSVLTIITVFLSLTSCEKEEQLTHAEATVENNEIPNYDGVSIVLINNYVNRYYIDLLGVQPLDSILNTRASTISTDPKNIELRDSLIQLTLHDTIYFSRFFSTTSLRFIEGIEIDELKQKQEEFKASRAIFEAEGDSLKVQYIDYELLKTDSLINATQRLRNNEIDLKAFYRAFCFNNVYDDINMGSLNFVIACFENLFGRQPTSDELNRAIDMVDGNSTYLFLSAGNSKSDFLSIMLNNPEFLIGRVYEVYEQLVQRKPSSSETIAGVQFIKNQPNLKPLQVSVAKTEEYAGF